MAPPVAVAEPEEVLLALDLLAVLAPEAVEDPEALLVAVDEPLAEV